MNKEIAPIILFCYNRVEYLIRTVMALRANELAEQSQLIIFSDGAKNEKDLEKTVKFYFPNANIDYMTLSEERHIDENVALSWWTKSYSKVLEENMKDIFIQSLKERDVPFNSTSAIIKIIPNKKEQEETEKSTKEWMSVHSKTK